MGLDTKSTWSECSFMKSAKERMVIAEVHDFVEAELRPIARELDDEGRMPIGAIIGEWVGASSGLGLVMMQANARLQTDFMFAALAVVVALAVVIRLIVDAATRHLVPWAPETAR